MWYFLGGLFQAAHVSYSSFHAWYPDMGFGSAGGNMYTLFMQGPIIGGLHEDPSVCVLVAGRGIGGLVPALVAARAV